LLKRPLLPSTSSIRVRVVDEHGSSGPKAQRYEIAMAAGTVHQEAEAIASEFRQVPGHEVAFRPA